MAAKQKRPPSPPPVPVISPVVLHSARVLILVALAISAYLAWVSLAHGTAVGCGPDSGCDKVLQSRWARWFGIPVSLLALLVDGLVLGWSIRLNPGTLAALQRRAWNWIVPGALLIAGAAVWFVGIQVFVLRALCPYCMGAHVSGFVAASLLLWAVPRRQEPAASPKRKEQSPLPPILISRGVGLAALPLAVLIVGQLVHHPKTFVVTTLGVDTNNVTSASSKGTNTSATSASGLLATGAPTNVPLAATQAIATGGATSGSRPERVFPVYGGRFEIKLHEVPLSGALTNERVMVSLFDYTCHHCRAMHPLLAELQHTFSNRLTIASLPMPLDPACNPTLVRLNPKHTNACEYARLGLIVWRANPAKHEAYENWVMQGEDHPPPLELARQQAIDLVGQPAFQQASQDPWIEQQLRQDIALYQFAYAAQQGSMPQLIFSSGMAVGTYSRDELFKMIENNLGLKAGP